VEGNFGWGIGPPRGILTTQGKRTKKVFGPTFITILGFETAIPIL